MGSCKGCTRTSISAVQVATTESRPVESGPHRVALVGDFGRWPLNSHLIESGRVVECLPTAQVLVFVEDDPEVLIEDRENVIRHGLRVAQRA